MKVSCWQKCNWDRVYWGCILSYLYPLYWQLFQIVFPFHPFCEGFRLTSYPCPHLEPVVIWLHLLPNRRKHPRWRRPRIREDFPSFNKQSNDTVLRINLLKEAQDQCGLSRVQRFILLRREISLLPFRIIPRLTYRSNKCPRSCACCTLHDVYSSARQARMRLCSTFARETSAQLRPRAKRELLLNGVA